MFEYKKLTKRYLEDAPFNKAVNLFRMLLEEYGFSPSEIREALFLAQYMYEMGHVEQIIRTEKEWKDLMDLKLKMQAMMVTDYPSLEKQIMVDAGLRKKDI